MSAALLILGFVVCVMVGTELAALDIYGSGRGLDHFNPPGKISPRRQGE